MKANIILISGIDVWHMAFNKNSPHLEYYFKNNELLASALHNSRAGVFPKYRKLLRGTLKTAFWGERKNILFIL